ARVRAHLDELLGPGVLGRTPLERLEHFPRYVRAIGRRLERLPGGLERDSERERTMQPLLEQHAARRAEHEER
ncbi:MAG: DUF3418 domain-containing protein, partial [Hydrogenophaga sp.]|uniref:DUF3418 domain-containing protein n=1 Tax=Hydrogenophaga sp. TaxID=1904254 RepID=UPI0016B53576